MFKSKINLQIDRYSKACLKRPLKKKTKNRLSRPIIAKCRSKVLQNAPLGAFCNTFDLYYAYHFVTIQNGWNNRISYGCVYAQIRSGLGMHLVTYSNHDTVLFLLIVPIKGRFVWDGVHCIYIYQRLHVFLILLEYLGNLVRFSIYKGWNFPFLLGDILNIPLKGSI